MAKQRTEHQYVAFLRGINVGGKVLIKMADLKALLEDMGFRAVRSILASGNLVFTTDGADEERLAKDIAGELKKAYGRDIGVMVRSLAALAKLAASEPFGAIKLTPTIRRYVTFLPRKRKPRSITIPYTSAAGDFRILATTGTEVVSVIDLAKGPGTVEAMAVLEKEFGKDVTTRNWNTVEKVLK